MKNVKERDNEDLVQNEVVKENSFFLFLLVFVFKCRYILLCSLFISIILFFTINSILTFFHPNFYQNQFEVEVIQNSRQKLSIIEVNEISDSLNIATDVLYFNEKFLDYMDITDTNTIEFYKSPINTDYSNIYFFKFESNKKNRTINVSFLLPARLLDSGSYQKITAYINSYLKFVSGESIKTEHNPYLDSIKKNYINDSELGLIENELVTKIINAGMLNDYKVYEEFKTKFNYQTERIYRQLAFLKSRKIMMDEERDKYYYRLGRIDVNSRKINYTISKFDIMKEEIRDSKLNKLKELNFYLKYKKSNVEKENILNVPKLKKAIFYKLGVFILPLILGVLISCLWFIWLVNRNRFKKLVFKDSSH